MVSARPASADGAARPAAEGRGHGLGEGTGGGGEGGRIDQGLRRGPCVRLGDLEDDEARKARARYRIPEGTLADPDARHPLTLRLLSEVRAALPDAPHARVDRDDVFSAYLDLMCLRIAVRLAAENGLRGTAVRRLAAKVSGQIHEAARRSLGPGQGELDREAFEAVFPWGQAPARLGGGSGWASAVLTEGLLVPAGTGYRFAHEELADWIQGMHLDLDEALRALVHRSRTPDAAHPLSVPHHRIGPVVQALLLVARQHGAPQLAARLEELAHALERDPHSWWAARLLTETLLRVPDATPYLAVLRLLADRLAAARGQGRPEARGQERPDPRGPGRPDARERERPDLWGQGRPDPRGQERPDPPEQERPDPREQDRPNPRETDGDDRPGPAVANAFAPGFWTALAISRTECLELLGVLLLADGPQDTAPRFLDAASDLLAADATAVQPLLTRWFDDDRPLPATPHATVANAAQALLHTHRHLALDDLTEVLVECAHRKADELLAVLAEDEPSAVCRAVDRWAHDERPARRVAAVAYGLRAAPHVRTEADRELLRYAALALLARPADSSLHGGALALLVRDPRTRARHLPQALRHFAAGDPHFPPGALVPALATHPEPVLDAFRDRLRRPDAGQALRTLADVTTPSLARRVAALVHEAVERRPETAVDVAAYVDRRLDQGPAGPGRAPPPGHRPSGRRSGRGAGRARGRTRRSRHPRLPPAAPRTPRPPAGPRTGPRRPGGPAARGRPVRRRATYASSSTAPVSSSSAPRTARPGSTARLVDLGRQVPGFAARMAGWLTDTPQDLGGGGRPQHPPDDREPVRRTSVRLSCAPACVGSQPPCRCGPVRARHGTLRPA